MVLYIERTFIMKVLQIIFCIISCLCVAGAVPAAVWLGWYALIFVAGAVVFGVAMAIVKKLTEPKYVMTDYMNSAEENAQILRERDGQNK